MALSAWPLVVLILLTTWGCIQSVKATNDNLNSASPQATPSAADSLLADRASPPNDNSLVEESSAPSSAAESVRFDGSPVSSTSPDGLPADSPRDLSPEGDSFPAISPSPDISPAPANSPTVSSPVASTAISTSNPPAVFVFGDSLVDPGNNNHIATLARANILFNGIDFPAGPTGRFCNGRTVVDILCDILGSPYPPPFLDPQTSGSRLLRGVNYASGAGGILDATGANFINRISMNQQISFFQDTTLLQLQTILGTDSTSKLLASSLVLIIIGSNDFINNYFLPNSVHSQYTPAQFNLLLISSFRRQLMELYSFGFQTFVVSAVGPVGCIPHQLAIAGQPTCVSSLNAQAQDFNALVKSLLQDLNSGLPDAMFLFGDSYASLTTLMNDASKYGFTVVNQGCCGGGLYRAQTLCQPAAAVCSNRKEYVFWDAYHPTEAANMFLANAMYTGGPKSITPMNLQALLARRQQPTS